MPKEQLHTTRADDLFDHFTVHQKRLAIVMYEHDYDIEVIEYMTNMPKDALYEVLNV